MHHCRPTLLRKRAGCATVAYLSGETLLRSGVRLDAGLQLIHTIGCVSVRWREGAARAHRVPRAVRKGVALRHQTYRVRVDLKRRLNAAVDGVFDQQRRPLPRVAAVAVTAGREQVVEQVDLAGARARHALVHVVRPPIMMPSDVQFALVPRNVVGRADQIRKAMPRVAGRIIAFGIFARGIVKLGPRHGNEVRTFGDVQIAVGAVGNVAMVEPKVVRAVVDGDRVVARRTAHGLVVVRIERTITDTVADDLDVAHDHVRRTTEAKVAVDLSAAQTNDGLVRAHVDFARRELAGDVNHFRGSAGNGAGKGRERGHRLRRRIATTGRRVDAHAGLRGPTN